jgi:hypothetical protein
MSFRFKSDDFVPRLSLLKVILSVLNVMLPSLSGEVGIRGSDRSEDQWRENLGSEEEFTAFACVPA